MSYPMFPLKIVPLQEEDSYDSSARNKGVGI